MTDFLIVLNSRSVRAPRILESLLLTKSRLQAVVSQI